MGRSVAAYGVSHWLVLLAAGAVVLARSGTWYQGTYALEYNTWLRWCRGR